MDIFAPSYYLDFHCLAEQCQHNCCRAGWEIDVDEETLAFYQQHGEIMEHICLEDTPHIRLLGNGWCPFLNDGSLCRLITDHGEEVLCQICRDHPRFRNFFESRTEIGVGLTCEAAVKLVLENDFQLVKIGEDEEPSAYLAEEEDFLDYRAALMLRDVTALYGLLPTVTLKQTSLFLRGLERLDTAWDAVLDTLERRDEPISAVPIHDITVANRLFQYFLFRHLHNFGLAFCVFCTYVVMALDGDVSECARLFSSEIEYSDDNTLATAEFVTQKSRSLD